MCFPVYLRTFKVIDFSRFYFIFSVNDLRGQIIRAYSVRHGKHHLDRNGSIQFQRCLLPNNQIFRAFDFRRIRQRRFLLGRHRRLFRRHGGIDEFVRFVIQIFLRFRAVIQQIRDDRLQLRRFFRVVQYRITII